MERLRKLLIKFQKNEITEYYVYNFLSKKLKGKNSKILKKIAKDELKHYKILRKYTGIDVQPSRISLLKYKILNKIFGLTFTVKLMEISEEKIGVDYGKIVGHVKEAKELIKEEFQHEKILLKLLEEEKIEYIGSMVLGLNDAIVELTGALAGLTFALQKTSLVGIAGLITGIAASLSMAASEYLSQKSESGKNPMKASAYTGIAYITTVLMLVLPYFFITNYFYAFSFMILLVFSTIFIFTFFVSVVKDLNFRKLFMEMAGISLGVAFVSFVIGILVRTFLKIEI